MHTDPIMLGLQTGITTLSADKCVFHFQAIVLQRKLLTPMQRFKRVALVCLSSCQAPVSTPKMGCLSSCLGSSFRFKGFIKGVRGNIHVFGLGPAESGWPKFKITENLPKNGIQLKIPQGFKTRLGQHKCTEKLHPA